MSQESTDFATLGQRVGDFIFQKTEVHNTVKIKKPFFQSRGTKLKKGLFDELEVKENFGFTGVADTK